jgi:hypothetical protein
MIPRFLRPEVVPFASVEIVRVPRKDDGTGVDAAAATPVGGGHERVPPGRATLVAEDRA